MTPEERFMAKVRVTAAGCWEWTACVLSDAPEGATYRVSAGYALFDDGRVRRAHRWAYEHFIGPIPDGMTLDHTCHTNDPTCAGGNTCPHRRCVNPAHLEPMTRSANMLAGSGPSAVNAGKTSCVHGHELNEANTYWRKDGKGRQCRICARHRTAAYNAKK